MKIAADFSNKYQMNQSKSKRVAFKEAPIIINGDIPMYLSKHKITEFPGFIRTLLQNEKVKNALASVHDVGLFINTHPKSEKVSISLKKLQANKKDSFVISRPAVDKSALLNDETVEGIAIGLKKETKALHKMK